MTCDKYSTGDGYRRIDVGECLITLEEDFKRYYAAQLADKWNALQRIQHLNRSCFK